MKFFDNEKNILAIIKYGAILPVVIFSFIITNVFINQKKQDLEDEINTLKTNYLNENKKIIKQEVEKVIVLINDEIKKSEETLKELLKNKVYEAHKVATILYEEESKDVESNGHFHSKEHVFNTIKRALTGISYNDDRGYYFIDDINGVKLLQPFNKEFEGKNMLEFEDANGYKFIKKISETIKNKTETYDTYYWYKPDNLTTSYKKMSFYKYFAPFNVAIGTGVYLVDFENSLKEKVLEWIRKIRHGENGYIFIFDSNGICLSHIQKEYIGRNELKTKNEVGSYPAKDILNLANQNKEGYLSYSAPFYHNFESAEKISYIKLFEKWNWTIGTGFYLAKLNNEIKIKEEALIKNSELVINKILAISAFITLFIIVLSFYISSILATKFKKYEKNIEEEINKTIEKEKLLVQQSKMAIMGEMIGNIAHQWKQPLSLISMSNTLLKLNKESEGFSTKEEINGAFENIDESVHYLSSTIDDFRNFFNPNKEKTYFSLETIFDKTFKLINSEFKNCNIEIIKNINDVKISGYQNELLQVLINIIKNAKDEFIRKENNLQKQLLFIDVYEKENQAIIKIKDNIGGIPNEIIDKIFEPYFTTKKENGGTGIGLYMSRQIVESLEGNIEVSNVEYDYDNEHYKGAEFIITFATK